METILFKRDGSQRQRERERERQREKRSQGMGIGVISLTGEKGTYLEEERREITDKNIF